MISHREAATNTSFANCPFLSGGQTNTVRLQPASCAGTPSINTVDGSGALPAGIYKPTLSIASVFKVQRTPGQVSTKTS